MTEKEIKEFVAEIRRKSDIFRNSGFATTGITNVFDKSADIIEELLPYMAIDTVEEFKALKEKATPKKNNNDSARCKNCGTYNNFIVDNLFNPKGHPVVYCWNCGQAIDWRE